MLYLMAATPFVIFNLLQLSWTATIAYAYQLFNAFAYLGKWEFQRRYARKDCCLRPHLFKVSIEHYFYHGKVDTAC